MRFTSVGRWDSFENSKPLTAYLRDDNWNDFGFHTLFQLLVADQTGQVHEIGNVRIAQFGMGESGSSRVPSRFSDLGPEYFSLGAKAEYYEQLHELGPEICRDVLTALGDIALDEDRFERALEEPVTSASLMRDISPVTVEGQFRRLANGEDRIIRYAFTYRDEGLRTTSANSLEFAVVPKSNPPTNIHAVIGSNGAGKTRLLDRMSRAIMFGPSRGHGHLQLEDGSAKFEGIVNLSFSAFDDLKPFDQNDEPDSGALNRTYIGLRQEGTKGQAGGATKSSSDLTRDVVEALSEIVRLEKQDRWRSAIDALAVDPLLKRANFGKLLDSTKSGNRVVDSGLHISGEIEQGASEAFEDLSSGHKIVLLATTKLVQVVEERTLVFMDEPESHLHPPLLSAFIGAISSLLAETNGVAIVSTHSPVVLQEIPRSCAWIIRRGASATKARRPTLETFAENIGALTHDVFGLEVTDTGFHARLTIAASELTSYEQVLAEFEDQVGSEGRALAQMLISMADNGVED